MTVTNPNQALAAVLDRIGAHNKPVNFGFDELQDWPPEIFQAIVKAKLLVKDSQAISLECSGCENSCFMPVVLTDDAKRAFIVCDHPDKQDHMGRIALPLARLQQWQANARQVAELVADLLAIETKPSYQKESTSYKLGMLKGDKGRCWVSLSTQPLALVINQQSVPISELLYFDDGILVIDHLRINELLNTKSSNTAKAYTPNTSKREERKRSTQAMYKDWQEEYIKLSRKHPNQSDTWYSMRIAKLPVAQGRDSETIRKNMKA